MLRFIKQWLTARDNLTYSATKLIGISAAITMIVQFVRTGSVDFISFGAGVTAIMAALAAKYYVEGK